jgi:hypothetical protein
MISGYKAFGRPGDERQFRQLLYADGISTKRYNMLK